MQGLLRVMTRRLTVMKLVFILSGEPLNYKLRTIALSRLFWSRMNCRARRDCKDKYIGIMTNRFPCRVEHRFRPKLHRMQRKGEGLVFVESEA